MGNRNPKEPLTAEKLRDVLVYDPATGQFTNRRWRGGKAHAGMPAGSVSAKGYLVISINNGVPQLAHRLAWLYVHGEWPNGGLDHINGNKLDNRIDNLRVVPQSVNLQNQRHPKGKTESGFLGVFRAGKKWTARINVDGIRHHLGNHETPEIAHAAYLAAKRRLHAGCAI